MGGETNRDGTTNSDAPAAASGPSPTSGVLMLFRDERPRLVTATDLAWLWHGQQTRKGRSTSYLSHLLAVEGLVVECGGGPDEAIAALLHDSLEDAPSARAIQSSGASERGDRWTRADASPSRARSRRWT